MSPLLYDVNRASTLQPPADSPKMVTLSGEPPNATSCQLPLPMRKRNESGPTCDVALNPVKTCSLVQEAKVLFGDGEFGGRGKT